MHGAADILDLEEARRYCGPAAGRLVAKLHGMIPDQVQELGTAVEQRAYEEVRALAHRLKGASAPLGAKRLSRAAAALETASKDADVEAVTQWLQVLTDEAELFRAAAASLPEA